MPNNLGIKVIPKENNRITTSYIKVQSIQNLDIEIPTGYNKSIIVTSSEYQKMCKDINNISSTINIRSKNFQIKFWCNAGVFIQEKYLLAKIVIVLTRKMMKKNILKILKLNN